MADGGKAYKLRERLQQRVELSRGDAAVLRDSPAKVAADLRDAAARYQMLSEVHRRFFMVAEQLAPMGMVPTERMLRDILNSVAARQESTWASRMRQMAQVGTLLDGVHSRWSDLSAQMPPSEALRQAFDEAFATEGGDALADFISPVMVEVDARTMWKRLGKGRNGPNAVDGEYRKALRDDYSERVVKRWWEATYPNERYGVNKARSRLKELKAQQGNVRGPFDPQASPRDIEEFFTKLRGGRQQVAGGTQGQYTVGVGRTGQRVESRYRSIPGTVAEEMERATKNLQLYTSAMDPNVNVIDFLGDPTAVQDVPSLHALLLRRVADDVEARLPTATKKQLAAIDAAEKAGAVEARNEAVLRRPYRNPDGVDPGSVKAMRQAVDKINRRRNSVDYPIAIADQELHESLVDLAGFDLWRAADPEGRPGFFIDRDGMLEQVSMPDGTPLTFSREEAESLYRAATSDDRAAINAALRQEGALLKRLAGERARVAEGLQTVTRTPTLARENPQVVRQWAKRLRELDNDIAAANVRLDDLRLEWRATDPATQQVALEKARILVHGFDGEGGWAKQAGALQDAARTQTPDLVARRIEGQQAAHARNPSRQLLDEIEELERSAGAKMFDQWLREGREAATYAKRLRVEADSVLAPIADDLSRVARDGSMFADPALRDAAGMVAGAVGEADPDALGRLVERMRAQADVVEGAPPLTDEAAAVPTDRFSRELDVAEGRLVTKQDQLGKATAARELAEENRDAAAAITERISAKLDDANEQVVKLSGQLDQALGDYLGRPIYKKQADGREVLVGYKGGLRGEAERLRGKRNQLRATFDEAAERYDHDIVVARKATEIKRDLVPKIQARKDVIDKVLEGAPPPNLGRTRKLTRDELDVARQWRRDADAVLKALNVDANDPAAKLLAAASKAEGDWILAGMKKAEAQNVLRALKQGRPAQDIKKGITREGWESLAEVMKLPSLQTTPEIKRMLENMQKLENPSFAREVNGLIGGYTQFFRAYATLSPGFHVRNAMSNSFMLLASGSSPKELRRGLQLFRSLREAENAGKTFGQWLESVPAAERAAAKQAAESMYAVGGGRTVEQLEVMLRRSHNKGGKINDNKVLRASRNVGATVEGSAHFMLGFDSAKKGLDFYEGTARVKRFLFDYRDVSAADENIRSLVPFWIWMSRNLPLQIVNQWANPKAYQVFGHLMRNLDEGDGDSIVPSWIREQGGVNVGGDTYFDPDMPQARLSEQLSELGDPARLLSYVNPGIRAPLEAIGNRQLYNNVPFADEPGPVELSVLSGPVANIMEGLGIAERNAEGRIVADPRWAYVIRNMAPPLAQGERLLPAGERGKQRQGQAWLNYLGVPIKEVTPAMRESERKRREREMSAIAKKAEQLGFTP